MHMTDRGRTLTIGFLASLTSSVFMVLLILAFRYFTGMPTLAESILDYATPLLPIPIFSEC